jgi:hypothetical protein
MFMEPHSVFSPPSPKDGNRSSFQNVVLLLPRTLGNGKSKKKPVILCSKTPSSETFKMYLKNQIFIYMGNN